MGIYVILLMLCLVMSRAADVLLERAEPEQGVLVAVYEHAFIPGSSLLPAPGEARGVMARNLQVYQRMAREASVKGAKLIVFPEDGVYGTSFTRDSIKPYLEEIPDPRAVEANPCTDPKYQHLFVQNKLSCMAREHSIYVVANVGEKVPCTSVQNPTCPPDKQFQYNTNVAYSPLGVLVAKYHKRNLFFEFQFDQPDVEYAIFDTEFGRFGTMTCFDVLFKEPALGLVEKYNIQHMAFPTAWGNEWPFLYAIQFHQAFAIRMGVNFLEAGFHRPPKKTGSGIYAGAEGARALYFNDTVGSPGQLVISRIPKSAKRPQKTDIEKIIVPVSNQTEFTGIVEGNVYLMVELAGLEGNVSIKSKDVSCRLYFKRKASPTNELYVLAVFDGLHYSSLNWYIQTCVLLKCANAKRQSCGTEIRYADTVFEHFELSGEFGTEYVFPSVVANDTDMPNSEWTYFIGENDPRRAMIRSGGMSKPLVTAGLYGRLYQRDNYGNYALYSGSDAAVLRVSYALLTITVVAVVLCAYYC